MDAELSQRYWHRSVGLAKVNEEEMLTCPTWFVLSALTTQSTRERPTAHHIRSIRNCDAA